jgi:hypothetical protein
MRIYKRIIFKIFENSKLDVLWLNNHLVEKN